MLSFVAGLVGVVAIGAAAWVYGETQREVAGVADALAEIRLSLEQLEGQAGGTADASASDSLLDLSNRLALLEQSWRSSLFGPGETPVPAVPAQAFAPPTATATQPTSGDCLPTGTRFMVAAGDSYPVCGTPALVEIGAVDNGFITLADGTVIAQGGTVGLPNSQCMVAVVPSDGGSLSGFAEIRVTC
ncbi:MAG: hypothetical protein JWP99_204 [Devosia sp.]|nr:hypothetical protein [Devosia sp.]